MHTPLIIITVLLYLACAFCPAQRKKSLSLGVLIAWLLHGVALKTEIFAPDALRFGFANMLSTILWVSVIAYWLGNRRFIFDSLRMLMLPIAAIAALLPTFFPGVVVSLDGRSNWFVWHIVISTLAYSVLTIAAFHAILMLLQDARLHPKVATKVTIKKKPSRFTQMLDHLPALLTMERLLFRLIKVGFILLTLTVLSGIVFSEQLFGAVVKWDHKTIFSLLSWIVFGALLIGRRWRGWRGKVALKFTLFGFVILLLAYIGSRFVLEVILHRAFI